MKANHEFVYLLFTHGHLDQAARLIRTLRLSSPAAAILLHHDAKSPLPSPNSCNELEYVYLVSPRTHVAWGNVTFLDATLRSLEYIQQHFEYSWVTVLSGQDYPLRPLSVIEDELRQSRYDAFIRAFPVTEKHYAYRYFMQYQYLPRFSYGHRIPTFLLSGALKTIRWLNHAQSIFRIEGGVRGSPYCLGIRAMKKPFSNDFRCFKGSDWFTINRRAIDYLLDFGRQNPDVLAYFRKTFIPSESYVPTVLKNSEELSVGSGNRHFICWNVPGAAHPKTLTFEDLTEIKLSNKDFGRKFDAKIDSFILDELDKLLFSRNHCTTGK